MEPDEKCSSKHEALGFGLTVAYRFSLQGMVLFRGRYGSLLALGSRQHGDGDHLVEKGKRK